MSFSMAGIGVARRGFTRAWWRVAAASSQQQGWSPRAWNPTRAMVNRHLETQREVTMGRGMEKMGRGMEKMGKQLLLGMATHARAIPVKGESIEVLETPSQFYDVLLQGVRNARSRVTIASLYIGTGTLEQELLDVIADSLAQNPSLQVTILCDALRTTRLSKESDVYPSSAAMLANILLSDNAAWRKTRRDRPREALQIALYHTPELTKLLKWVLPARAREIVGVCHLKAFIFDDTVIMTGANMSTSYFTVRQDRYLCFPDNKDLASHFSSLIDMVASYSYNLDMFGKLQLQPANLDPMMRPEVFRTEMTDSARDLTLLSKIDMRKEIDTWVFPTMQMGPLGIRQDEHLMMWLLKHLPAGSDLHLSSPYFNLTPEYEELLLKAAEDKNMRILTASPKANGFYGSPGISGSIPLAYSLLEQKLYNRSRSEGKHQGAKNMVGQKKIGLSFYEYERPGWTFHAKGLWCSLPGEEDGPSISLIGSSNLGYRSRDRDLEAQLWLFTTSPRLRLQLERERDDLFVRAAQVNASVFIGPDRQGGLLTSLALHLVRPWL